MTATPTPPPSSTPSGPWRVKLRAHGHTWMSHGLTEDEAVHLTRELAGSVVNTAGDTPALIGFPTRHGVTAYIRGRDVLSVEPVGPRWDGEDQPHHRDDDGDRQPQTGVLVDVEPAPPSPAVLAARAIHSASRRTA